MIRAGHVLLAAASAALPACVPPLPGETLDTDGGGGTAGMQGSGGQAGRPNPGPQGGTTDAAGQWDAPNDAGSGPGVRFVCPSNQILDCAGSPLTLPNGHVTTFSAQEWSPIEGHFCNASGLRGSVFSYAGPEGTSASALGVELPAGDLRLLLTVGPGGYAGGGLAFDRCVNASAFNALRFTAWAAGGDIAGCNFRAQLQTFEQRPTSQLPPGGCDQSAGDCFRLPSSPNLMPTPIPTPFTVPFSDFTTSAVHANPVPGELVGLQWQLESGPPLTDGGLQPICMVDIRLDDIDFVAQ